MSTEIFKRINTSLCLIILLTSAFFYSFILIASLIIISLIAWIEFIGLISKIYTEDNFYSKVINFFIKFISLFYLIFFSILIFNGLTQVEPNLKFHTLYLFIVCIFSDIGGLIFGKIFKGKKLTKISPNKTRAGSIGSFILSLLTVPTFYYSFTNFDNIFNLIIVSILVSFFCQLGDLIISYIKRLAGVKNTGNILPGHGGVLDRIDGMLLAIPVGVLIWKFLVYNI
tara:strand:+ start:1843 stop:2523 length:681 start_codon:yes stop_codon:yes gene_type:complete